MFERSELCPERGIGKGANFFDDMNRLQQFSAPTKFMTREVIGQPSQPKFNKMLKNDRKGRAAGSSMIAGNSTSASSISNSSSSIYIFFL